MPLPESDFSSDIIDRIEKCQEVLAGMPLSHQGAALAELVAWWLASHPEERHNVLLEHHRASVRRMLVIVQQAMDEAAFNATGRAPDE